VGRGNSQLFPTKDPKFQNFPTNCPKTNPKIPNFWLNFPNSCSEYVLGGEYVFGGELQGGNGGELQGSE
jgi:hypothetical protein